MSKAAEAGLINAEMVLKFRENELKRTIDKLAKEERKEKKELLKLMKAGDDEMINGQAELVGNIQGNIREMTRSKQRLHVFGAKIRSARMNQSIGASMVAVSRALGRVTQSIQLEKIEAVMEDLSKQYNDIDVMTSVLDTATSQTTASTVSPEAVERLKRQVADEAGLELSQDLNSPGVVTAAPVKSGPTAEEEAESAERLKALRLNA